jgi:hypothetical protein
MPSIDVVFWCDRVRQTLQHYAEPLLQQVAARLFKPRSHWPAEELIERSLATIQNAAVIDRRLEALEAPCRRLLALIGHSRQPLWKLGSLLELLAALGHAEGLLPVFTLFEAGLLYPDLPTPAPATTAEAGQVNAPLPLLRLESFEQWVGQAGTTGLAVFAPPQVTSRALGVDLGLPELAGAPAANTGVREADGLEWPLRLAALWQQAGDAPLRRTQQREFFKRDLDRLRTEALLTAPPADALAELPDPGLFIVALAETEGLIEAAEAELRARPLPALWDRGLPDLLASLWAALPHLDTWDPRQGWRGGQPLGGNPFPSTYLLALLLLARLPKETWIHPETVADWIAEHHPYWREERRRPPPRTGWVPTFLLGVAYPLRLLQASRDVAGDTVVRLSPLGRWILGFDELPPALPSYPQSLLVQPNLEIVAYRQGLTPALIARLTRFAAWKSFGAACTLQLHPETVYRGLESGLTFEAILQTLEQQGMRPTPPTVIESLRTWADKRERISVYPSATLFEFSSAEDLNEALARGLPGVRLSERLAVVANESAIDFRHFRLSGTRDYALPPEKCVEVEADGVTLVVDVTRSDLLLETELQRFAEPCDGPGVNGRRRYRLTPASLAAGRDSGLSVRTLDEWFMQRSGRPLSPAARLLLNGCQAPVAALRRQLVLHVATEELAEGLLQWPVTRPLIQEQLGPTALAVAEEHADELAQQLRNLGTLVQIDSGSEQPVNGDPK